MELNSKFLSYYLKSPIRVFHMLRYKLYLKQHPGVPWMAPKVIDYLDRLITTDFQILEWGSGGSTQWFAQRCGRIMSVENNEDWYAKVKSDIGQKGITNVDYRLFKDSDTGYDQVGAIQSGNLPEYVSVISEFPEDSLDLVIVDGAFRHLCVHAAPKYIKPGGYLLIDNSNWRTKEQWGVPMEWEEVAHHDWNVACTTIWQKPKN